MAGREVGGGVGAGAAAEAVGSGAAGQPVVALPADQGVRVVTTVDDVVAAAAAEQVVAGEPVQGVDAVLAKQDVRAGRASQRVIAVPPAEIEAVIVPFAEPSETLIVISAVPLLPEAVLTVIVRAPPLPAKTRFPFGTSTTLLELADKTSPPTGLSRSATARLSVPERSSLPQLPPAATATVGASLTAFTVIVTVATFEFAVPSFAL